jgi:ABC-type branched-subunit amino acid transport system substrate-binding protein
VRAGLVVAALAVGCQQAPAPTRPTGPPPGERHIGVGPRLMEEADAGPVGERRRPARMSEAEAEAIAARVEQMSAAQLAASWARMDPDADAAQAVALRLALLSRHAGDLDGARRWLGRAGSGARAREVAAALDLDRPARPAQVAVLLPLSGRHARLGREMRPAIEVAAEGGAEGESDRAPVTLRFYDTRGDRSEAARQVARAAAEGAVGILGPVGQAEARAAAQRSIDHGVAIGLLAPDDVGAAPEVGVFRLWPSATWEAGEAARRAVELGHDAVAVLHPRDEQGAAQAEAFRHAAEAAGARVVASGDYDAGGAGLEADVKRFLGLDPARNERLRRHLRQRGAKGWKSFSPDVEFGLLYVPDQHRSAALVAAFLPYFNIEVRSADVMDTPSLRRKHGGRIPPVVQLLGSSGWYHAGLLSRGGAAVDGALVVVPCAPITAEGASADASDFAERFETRAGHAPGPVAAQAHDAAALFFAAHQAALARSGDPRSDLTFALRRAALPDGACGPSRIAEDGQLERAASLLRVEAGDFVPVDP